MRKFENDLDLVNIVEITRSAQSIAAIVNAYGSKKQFVFGWEVSPLHETSLSSEIFESLISGIKEIEKGETLTFVSSSFAEDMDYKCQFDTLINRTSTREYKFFLYGIQNRIAKLIDDGQRKAKKIYAFATYTIDPKSLDTEDFLESFLARLFSVFKKQVSKSNAFDVEQLQSLLRGAFDVWQERHMLLTNKMQLIAKPLDRQALWEYMRFAINGSSYGMPLPHSLELNEERLAAHYHSEQTAAQKGLKQVVHPAERLHMTSLLVPHQNVPVADRKFVYLPGRNAYLGVLRLDELPDGWTDELAEMKWLWDGVMSHPKVVDIEIVTQFSSVNENDLIVATRRYTQQQEAMQNRGFETGRRDRIAEFRADEAGEAQLSLIKGDRVVGVGFAINVFAFLDPDLKRRNPQKAHAQAVEVLRGKLRYIQNRFRLPAIAAHEQDYPWQTWLQSLPCKAELLCGSPQDFRRRVNASAAVGFTQLVGICSRCDSGTELISEKGGSPVKVGLADTFGSPRHGAFFGKSGSGKSTLVAPFLIDALIQGMNVTIMDYPKSKWSSTYTWLVKFLGGAEFDTGKTCNNLLEYLDLSAIPIEDHPLRISNFQKNVTNVLVSLVLDESGDTGQSVSNIRSLLGLAVASFYNNPQILDRCADARAAGIRSAAWRDWPTLFDFYHQFTPQNLGLDEFGDDIERAFAFIRFRLRCWLDSPLGASIAQPSSFDGSERLTLFALRDISSNEEAAVLGLSAQTAAMRSAFASQRSLFYCDEVSVLLRFSNLANVIGSFMATGRAAGLSVLLASQDPVALQSCPPEVSAQILQNLSFKLIGRIDPAAIKAYVSLFEYPRQIIEPNAQEGFLPSLRDIYSRWLLDDDGRITACRYYPAMNILGIVANNAPEVYAREVFEKRYPDKYEALGRFSKFLYEACRRGEPISEADVRQLQEQFRERLAVPKEVMMHCSDR